jgi:hypothetical protein
MFSLLSLVFQFAVTASDPSWSCEVTHRDPTIRGTFYLYCSKTSPEGIELVQVGRFISDQRTAKASQP